MPDAPPSDIPTDAAPEVTAEPAPPEVVAEATSEPTAEPEPAVTEAPAATKPPAKKTRAPKPVAEEPEATREPERKKAPKAQVYDVSHVHGGLKKKVCSGAIELNDTGLKYDATTSEDDNLHHVEVTFSQVKKVEMKDAKNVDVATTDKKWTFRGDGLIVAKITTHLQMHKDQWAGK
jgi:hypothetical protein